MKTDSFGNKLPNSIFLRSNESPNELGKALNVNTFLLAVEMAMEKKKIVNYDDKTMTATITDSNGMSYFVSHG